MTTRIEAQNDLMQLLSSFHIDPEGYLVCNVCERDFEIHGSEWGTLEELVTWVVAHEGTHDLSKLE